MPGVTPFASGVPFFFVRGAPPGNVGYFLDGVRVPHSAILGEEGKGFELAMRWIGKGRYMLPARALGSCERLVEMGMEWARNRVTFGQPIAERQAIQWMVADSAVEIEALRWLAVQAHRFGDPLRAGHLVLSGALGPFVPFAPGDRVTATISGFAPLTATFTE